MGEERQRTKFHNKLKTILNEVNAHRTTPLNVITAREHMVTLEETFKKFETVQEKLETTAVDDAAFNTQTAAGELVEKTFSDARGKLRYIIDLLTTTPSSSSSTSSSSSSSTAKVKLPPVPLVTFDGSYESWIAFKDLFTAQVGGKTDVSGAQKLAYLKSSLKGEVLALIDDLSTTDANYTEAWKLLKERYEVKREIVRAHVSKLIKMKPAKQESATELQVLIDSFVKSLRCLATLGCPTDKWDDLTVFLVEEKLDPVTRREWAKRHTGTDTSKFDELAAFLQGHIRGLQAAGASNLNQPTVRRGDRQVKVNHVATENGKCVICGGAHRINDCKEFLGKSAKERSTMVKNGRLCFNCLKPDHHIKDCTSTRKCKKCDRRHHTFLHEERGQQTTAVEPTSGPAVSGNHVQVDSRGIVMTVLVHVKDKFGVPQPCRAFLDPGATADFITEACTNRLGLAREAGCVSVTGFGDTKVGQSKGLVRTILFSRVNSKQVEVELHVMTKLTGTLPTVKCQNGSWKHLEGLTLADPRWYQPGSIDIVLGIKYYHKLMLTRRIVSQDEDAPVAWETIFGWVVAGACPVDNGIPVPSFHVSVDPIDQQLRKFWEMEEPPKQRILTVEEKKCEEHFLATYTRDDTGRFIVAVPFHEDKKKTLGRSRDIAYRRLLQVERRLSRNSALCKQYAEFMQEYESLGHMRLLPEVECGETVGVTNYLCHHFVVNDSSTTTKLRVVFDGSAATSTGVSLNSCMMVGATLQDDLYDLLLRLRTQAVVLKADMTKMFRQFRLRPEEAKFHRVLWRESPELPLREYELSTITYGTACAPNLSTRCIQQLGLDCALEYPIASKILLQDTYIDDTLSGMSTAEEAIEAFHQLTSAVATAGLELRKWVSNDKAVMDAIPESMRETSQVVFDDNEMVKALGVQWQPLLDNFTFKPVEFQTSNSLTKRSLLSELARVFDPLGLISCVILRGKLLLQELWKLQIGWDDAVPEFMKEKWEEYKLDLSHLHIIQIPRRIAVSGAERVELHGFADSSEASLGGIVYMRSLMPNGRVEVRFVTSKTKVAPVRQVTLPRLELCAAVLVAELIIHVKECLQLNVDIHLWSDSTITLTWIAGTPRRWKTYVANRVAAIQELTNTENWRHVSGVENPADLASRGCSVEEVSKSELWWTGPKWLSSHTFPEFPKSAVSDAVDMEERRVPEVAHHVTVEEHPILKQFSNLTRLKRLTAWFLRYIEVKYLKKNISGPLTAAELQQALLYWVRQTQSQFFVEEFQRLIKEGRVSKSNKLKALHPYIDNANILRVSGRLRNAALPEKIAHQIILPGNRHLSTLIGRHVHERCLHGDFNSLGQQCRPSIGLSVGDGECQSWRSSSISGGPTTGDLENGKDNRSPPRSRWKGTRGSSKDSHHHPEESYS